jgi:plastocyanin
VKEITMTANIAARRGQARESLLSLGAALLLSLAGGTLLFALVQPSLVWANQSKVGIDNFAFTPAILAVKAGTTVVFENHDDIPHSVVGADFRAPALDTSDRFSYTFTKPGTYDYFCGLHPHMTGKVIVTP